MILMLANCNESMLPYSMCVSHLGPANNVVKNIKSDRRWKPVRSFGQSGYRSGRDSSTSRASRLKNWSNSIFLQLKTSKHQPKYTYIL